MGSSPAVDSDGVLYQMKLTYGRRLVAAAPTSGVREPACQGDDDRLAHPPAKAPDPLVEPQASAEVGWFCSHSQASSTIVVLCRRLPALDTPYS
jgi:hypothetical protein